MQPPGWRGHPARAPRTAHSCRGSASRERNHGVGDHPIPFRTRQLSPTSPKVLRREAAGGQVVPLAGGAFSVLTSYEIASTEEACFRDAHAGVFLFRLVSLHGARSAAGKKPPAMRVRVEGSALASKRRQSGYDTGVQVVSARKGGRFGKQGTQPVAHEVDVQVPHRVHTEV